MGVSAQKPAQRPKNSWQNWRLTGTKPASPKPTLRMERQTMVYISTLSRKEWVSRKIDKLVPNPVVALGTESATFIFRLITTEQ
jgi:hypothetical protein